MDTVLVRSYVCPVTVGRRLELALIGDRLQRAAPGVILVAGEAGIGKSRLVGEAAAEAGRLGYRVVRGHCFESDAGLPFAPLRDLLRSLSADHNPDRLAAPYAAPLARLFPELGATSQKALLRQGPTRSSP